jgi:hypothetical protein
VIALSEKTVFAANEKDEEPLSISINEEDLTLPLDSAIANDKKFKQYKGYLSKNTENADNSFTHRGS